VILSKSIILKYRDVTCLFNQKVHKYITVDMKCQMPDNNVLVNYGTQ
jgi:hypothetical protein